MHRRRHRLRPCHFLELVRLELILLACASSTAALPGPSSPPRRSFHLLVHAHTPHVNAIGRNIEDRPDLGGLRSNMSTRMPRFSSGSTVSTSLPRFSSGSVMLDPLLGSYCSEFWLDTRLLLTTQHPARHGGKAILLFSYSSRSHKY